VRIGEHVQFQTSRTTYAPPKKTCEHHKTTRIYNKGSTEPYLRDLAPVVAMRLL
jgi:hypothetical protein